MLIVPPRRNATPWAAETPGAAEGNEALRAIKRFGRRVWKQLSGYHRGSLVETATSRLKRLGERLAARDSARQVRALRPSPHWFQTAPASPHIRASSMWPS